MARSAGVVAEEWTPVQDEGWIGSVARDSARVVAEGLALQQSGRLTSSAFGFLR